MSPKDRESPLTHSELLMLVSYDPDTGHFSSRRMRAGLRQNGKRLGCLEPNGYRRLCIKRRRYMAGRLAWFYITGVWPVNQIDHANMIRDDNSWINLREATPAQNLANRPGKRNGLKGVFYNKILKKWKSTIRINGKCVYLGTFLDEVSAHEAYMRAAKHVHGEFARAA